MNSYREQTYTEYRPPDLVELATSRKVFVYNFRRWLPTTKSSSIFDAGCGQGEFLMCLKSLGYRNVHGVDLSESQIEIAQGRGLEVTTEDALVRLAQTNAYDMVVALDMVEHLTKDELLKFISLSYNRLKAGGRLVLQLPNPNNPFFGSIRYGDLTHELGLAPSLMEYQLLKMGFKETELREVVPIPWGYSWKSSLRFFLWKMIRGIYRMINLVETGTAGQVYSRVYLICGTKP